MLSRCSESQTLRGLCHIYLQSQLWRTTLCSLGSADGVPSHRCVVPLFTTFRVFSEDKYSPELQGANDGSDSKTSAYNAGDPGSIPGLGRSSGEGNGNPLQYSCLEKSHGWRSVIGYSPWGRKELDTTEQLHFHFQCPQEENPTNGV